MGVENSDFPPPLFERLKRPFLLNILVIISFIAVIILSVMTYFFLPKYVYIVNIGFPVYLFLIFLIYVCWHQKHPSK
ncbi:MAG: hypothetical protein ABIH38_05470 [Patescibacteria group bacterium]